MKIISITGNITLLLLISCSFMKHPSLWEKTIELHKDNLKIGAKFSFPNTENTLLGDLAGFDFVPEKKGFLGLSYNLPITEQQMQIEGIEQNQAIHYLYPAILYFSEKKQKLKLSSGDNKVLLSKKTGKAISAKIQCNLIELLKPQDFSENKVNKFLDKIIENSKNPDFLKQVTTENLEEVLAKCSTELNKDSDISCTMNIQMYVNVKLFYERNYDLPAYECFF